MLSLIGTTSIATSPIAIMANESINTMSLEKETLINSDLSFLENMPIYLWNRYYLEYRTIDDLIRDVEHEMESFWAVEIAPYIQIKDIIDDFTGESITDKDVQGYTSLKRQHFILLKLYQVNLVLKMVFMVKQIL